MSKGLERTLSEDELRYLTQTIVVKKRPVPEGTPDHRPKVKSITTAEASVVRIMGTAVFALNQKGLTESAEKLRKRILRGDYEQPADALELIGNYGRMKIVDEEGREIGSID